MPEALQTGVRVTLAMGDAPEPEPSPAGEGEVLPARLVSPSEPREAAGLYWGYTTRLAAGLSAALSDCPFEVTEHNMCCTGDIVRLCSSHLKHRRGTAACN